MLLNEHNVNTTINRKDFVQYNKFCYIKKRLKSTIKFIFILMIMVSALLNIGHLTLSNFIFTFFYFSCILIPLMVIFYFVGFYLLRYYPSKNGSILGEKTITINDKGLTEKSNESTTQISWKGIQSIEENNQAIYIFIDNVMAFIIPKRDFESKHHENQFKAFCLEKTEQIN